MSKSSPDSAIFMEDTEADVDRKVKKAFCPERVVDQNPVVDYARHILIPALEDGFPVTKKADQSVKVYKDYAELE